MGTWAASLFSDDVACDVRDRYLALLSTGVDGPEASRALESEWDDVIRDTDEGPVFWIALAATQWTYGQLLPQVKARTLEIIDREEDLQRWLESPDLARRRKALQTLRRKLLSPQPAPRRPRRRKIVEPKAFKLEAPDGRASATVWDVGDSETTENPVAQVYIEMQSNGHDGGGGVTVARCRWSRVGLEWIDNETLEVSCPAGTTFESRKETSFFYGRVIAVVYRTEEGVV